MMLLMAALRGCNSPVPSASGTPTEKLQAYLESAEPLRANEVRKLIHAGADFNVRNSKGATPLYVVAMAGQVDVVQQLLESNADVEAVHVENGGTALRAAEMNHHDEVIRLQQKNDAGQQV